MSVQTYSTHGTICRSFYHRSATVFDSLFKDGLINFYIRYADDILALIKDYILGTLLSIFYYNVTISTPA